jgi:hypothetical protein
MFTRRNQEPGVTRAHHGARAVCISSGRVRGYSRMLFPLLRSASCRRSEAYCGSTPASSGCRDLFGLPVTPLDSLGLGIFKPSARQCSERHLNRSLVSWLSAVLLPQPSTVQFQLFPGSQCQWVSAPWSAPAIVSARVACVVMHMLLCVVGLVVCLSVSASGWKPDVACRVSGRATTHLCR